MANSVNGLNMMVPGAMGAMMMIPGGTIPMTAAGQPQWAAHASLRTAAV